MLISKFKRILRTDYADQFKDLVDKLGFSLNNTIESIVSALNKGISLQDNIQCTVKTLQVTVDSTGKPTTSTSFTMSISQKPIGVVCLNAQNTTNSSSYSTSGITVYWTLQNSSIVINNITGLLANNTYQLTLVAFA